MKHIYLLTVAFFLLVKGFGQNQTVSFPTCLNGFENCYQCNVFKAGCSGNIWGCPLYSIKTSHGSPDYTHESFGNVVRMESSYSVAGGSKSEGFFLSYNFKPGYKYIISVLADAPADKRPPNQNPSKLMLQLTNSLTVNNNDGCNMGNKPTPTGDFTAPQNIYYTTTGGYGNTQVTINVALGKSYSQLFLYTDNLSANGAGAVTVKEINITEQRPEFALTPTALTVACADNAPITFQLNNPQNINGGAAITYNWLVGAGWLYNGQPAPSNITTSSNTLILTPVGTSAPSNVTAAPLINGSLYNTYVCNVTFDNSLSDIYITGPRNFCTTAAYTLSKSVNNPAWSASPAGIVTVTPSGSGATLNKQQNDGNIVLSAAFTACGVAKTATYNVTAGFPSGSVTIMGANEASAGGIFTYTLKSTPLQLLNSLQSVTWQVPSGWTIISYLANNGIQVMAGNQPGYIQAGPTICGLKRGVSKYVTIGGGIGSRIGMVSENDSVLVYPNPAKNNLFVDISKLATKVVKLQTFEIQLYDLKYNLVKSVKGLGNAANINVQGVRPGNYFLRITVANKQITKQVIITE